LESRVCLITGAANGVGREVALQFAAAGCRLILWDLNREGLEETVALVNKASGVQCLVQVLDVSDRHEVYAKAAEASAWAAPGHVSILVNNAGILGGKAFLDTEDERLVKTFQVNSLAHFWTCKAFLPAMIKAKQGHVVTVASVSGLTPAPLMVAYSASKHAAVGFASGLRKELKVLGHHEIRTSVVCPAHIQTKLFEGFKQPLLPSLNPQDVAAQILHCVQRNQAEAVMPFGADPRLLQALMPISVLEKLEAVLGLDGKMMANINLGQAEKVMQMESAGTRSKL